MADLKRPGDEIVVEEETHDRAAHVATARVKVVRGGKTERATVTLDAGPTCAMALEIAQRLAAGEKSGSGPVGLLEIRLRNLRNPPDSRFQTLVERAKAKAEYAALVKHDPAAAEVANDEPRPGRR